MFVLDFDFVLLNIALLLVFFAAGILVSQGRSYIRCSGICILVFSIIEGCRYMRGNDYAHYLDVYNFDLEPDEKLYTWFCDFLKFCGVPDYMSFFFYALVFSTCLFVFLHRFKKHAYLLFPLSVIALLVFHEFMIRQELSYAFVFLYLDSMFSIGASVSLDKFKFRVEACRKDWINLAKCVLFAAMAMSIHSANVFPIALLTLFYILRLKPFDWRIIAPILIFTAYIFPLIFDLSSLEPVINVLAGNNAKLSGYADRFDFWFSDEAVNEQYTRKPVILVYEMLGHLSLAYLVCRISKEVKSDISVNAIFNGYVFGAVFMNTFRNLEILNRIGYVFEILWFIPLCFVLTQCRKVQLKAYEKCLFFFLTFFVYDYLRYLFLSPGMTLFLWDA